MNARARRRKWWIAYRFSRLGCEHGISPRSLSGGPEKILPLILFIQESCVSTNFVPGPRLGTRKVPA